MKSGVRMIRDIKVRKSLCKYLVCTQDSADAAKDCLAYNTKDTTLHSSFSLSKVMLAKIELYLKLYKDVLALILGLYI